MIRKIISGLLIITISLGVCACGTEHVVDDIEDQVSNMVQSEEEHVLSVKRGTNNNYPGVSYQDAFEHFFGSPTWKYFKGTQEGPDEDEDGKPDYTKTDIDIVEFTGTCTYQNVNVKALIQFVLDVEEDTFQASYLSFNGVPQSSIMLAALISNVFETYIEDNNMDPALDSEENIIANDQDEIDSDIDQEENIMSSGILSQFDYNLYVNSVGDSVEIFDEDGEYAIYLNGNPYYETELNFVDDGDIYIWSYGKGLCIKYYFDDDCFEVEWDGESSGYYYTGYILPFSQSEYIERYELETMSPDEIRLARNEIFARHGRKFDSKDLTEYFESCSWYEGIIDADEFDENVLNQYEKKNLDIISAYEQNQ